MGGNESISADKSDSTAAIKTTSSPVNVVVPRRENKLPTVQSVLLIWLDKGLDENRPDYYSTLTELQRGINTINTYTDGDECIQFLKTIKQDKACMVIQGSLGQNIVPRVHDMPQVDSIFIFCQNRQYHEGWANQWPKIKGVFTAIVPICQAIKDAAQQCDNNAISMSFMTTSENISKKSLDQLDLSFMYMQILKEILRTIQFEERHFKEFVEYCRDVFNDNEGELENINKLEQNYRNETPTWWYTFDHFLYSVLNRSLRTMDVDIIIKMSFFIDDLNRHIDRLHKEQFNTLNSSTSFQVYRGQGMTKNEFEQMKKTMDGLMSFNNFLSTRINHKVSVDFINAAIKNPDLIGVLFVITINPSQSTTPFASITDVSYYKDKADEILFPMHTVFRIVDIKSIDRNQRLYQVDLRLTNNNDKDLSQITNRIRQETEGLTGWDQLGELLLRVGQAEKADHVYHILLRQTKKENQLARIYHQFGKTKGLLGQHEESVFFNEQALAIRERTLPPDHPDFAKSYNNIGLAYYNLGEYSKALVYYEKTLEIDKKTLPPNHPELAMSYNSIGLANEHLGEYAKAHSFYEHSVKIAEQSLPSNHPELQKYRNNLYILKKKL